MFHRVDGQGEPLVLLNGIAMSVASWEEVARPLAERFRVVRFDFRGQLLSPGDPPADVREHAADTVDLLDRLGIDRAHLVATSFGGAVALLVAARWPERVQSLVSIASADAFDASMAEEVARWRRACVDALATGDPALLSDALEPVVYSAGYLAAHEPARALRRRQLAALPDAWFEGLIGLIDSTPSVALSGELAAVRCPTMVIAAELDRFIPLARTRALADGIRGARFTVIEGAGHAVVIEQPERIATLCLDFVANLGSRLGAGPLT
ncbi:MAG TPA: alpha/beta fold hydrolase [Thermoanaerobaculales bacterium]|nr:alpha/beta fold hydrolase [Thermoanaerobaculales bacterium]HQN96202.1 alpha/beta fold hydrolase [Thermoanaerobaculales bacterium]HQP45039.1 alpha/beta fold hydrolase [Thermoanaerobaculales bacterium]